MSRATHKIVVALRRAIAAAAFLLLIGIGRLSADAEDALRIRVLSYNIHHGEGVDGKLDLPRVAGVIRSVSPDIVALQEVDRGTARTGKIDQPAELARLTGMHLLFERNIDFEGGQYGNAILSRQPAASHKNVLLPSFDEGEQRGVLIAEFPPETGGPGWRFFCTHLDHRRDDREQLASAAKINELAGEVSTAPAILAGDLNAVIDSRVLSEFEKFWTRANRQELPTIPVAGPQRQIDFILFRPAERFRVEEVRVLDEKIASDHRAIFAELELISTAR